MDLRTEYNDYWSGLASKVPDNESNYSMQLVTTPEGYAVLTISNPRK